MDELNMRLPILQHTSERLLRNVTIVLIAGFGAGCSADTMRFTDGILLVLRPVSPSRSNPQAMFMRLPRGFGPAGFKRNGPAQFLAAGIVSASGCACRCGIDADAQSGRSSPGYGGVPRQ